MSAVPQGMTTTKAPMTGTPMTITHEMIAKRAYEKWVKRGRPMGTQMQDWLEAEMELKKECGVGCNYPAGR
jgi:hypothetical protein